MSILVHFHTWWKFGIRTAICQVSSLLFSKSTIFGYGKTQKSVILIFFRKFISWRFNYGLKLHEFEVKGPVLCLRCFLKISKSLTFLVKRSFPKSIIKIYVFYKKYIYFFKKINIMVQVCKIFKNKKMKSSLPSWFLIGNLSKNFFGGLSTYFLKKLQYFG